MCKNNLNVDEIIYRFEKSIILVKKITIVIKLILFQQVGRRRGIEPESTDHVDGHLRTSASDGRLPDMAADFPSLEMSAQSTGSSSGAPGKLFKLL